MHDDLVWIVNDLEEFKQRIDDNHIVEYDGVAEPMLDGTVTIRMNYVRYRNGRERGNRRE